MDLREPVEGGLSGLSVDGVEGLAVGGVHVGDEIVNLRLGLEEDLAERVALLRVDLDEEIGGIIEDLTEVEGLSLDLAEHLSVEPGLFNVNDSCGDSGHGGSKDGELHCRVCDSSLET